MTCTVGGVSLTCKEEHDRTLRVVDNLAQTVQIGEQQVGTLIGGKAAAEADNEGIGVELTEQVDHT